MSVLELSFPDAVDDRAARTVASCVVAVTVAALVTQWPVVVVLLAAGFWLRVRYGPRYSPVTLLLVPAGREAALGLCVGCKAFGLLLRLGVIPPSVCDRCVWRPLDRSSGSA